MRSLTFFLHFTILLFLINGILMRIIYCEWLTCYD